MHAFLRQPGFDQVQVHTSVGTTLLVLSCSLEKKPVHTEHVHVRSKNSTCDTFQQLINFAKGQSKRVKEYCFQALSCACLRLITCVCQGSIKSTGLDWRRIEYPECSFNASYWSFLIILLIHAIALLLLPQHLWVHAILVFKNLQHPIIVSYNVWSILSHFFINNKVTVSRTAN